MNCPRDGAELRSLVRSGTTIDVCERCHGKWLDEGELEALALAATRTGATTESLRTALSTAERPRFFHALERDPELDCPRCGVAMEKVRFESGGTELTADRCGACRGFWLDAGETGSLFVFLEERLPVRRLVWVAAAAILAAGAVTSCWLLAR